MLGKRKCSHQTVGTYKLICLECCVHLVASTRPSKSHARAMLEAISRVIGSPSRERILAALSQALDQSDSQCQAQPLAKAGLSSQDEESL